MYLEQYIFKWILFHRLSFGTIFERGFVASNMLTFYVFINSNKRLAGLGLVCNFRKTGFSLILAFLSPDYFDPRGKATNHPIFFFMGCAMMFSLLITLQQQMNAITSHLNLLQKQYIFLNIRDVSQIQTRWKVK